MKPRNLLAESTTPDGAPMSLHEHDGAYSISYHGQELMHSKASASELILGKLEIELVRKEPRPRLMIGGLGLGFTLRTVLEMECGCLV
jgi:spermidine synthase